MATSRDLLTDAGQHLVAAEALITRAGDQLGPPFDEGLEHLAAEIERARRRLRNATTTATATMGDSGG